MTIWSATQTFRLNEQIKESAEKLLFAMSDTQCSMRKYTHAHNTIERRQSDQRIEMNQWCAREVDTRLRQASPRTTEAHTCISWYSLNFRTHFYSNYGCSKFIACSINCSAKKKRTFQWLLNFLSLRNYKRQFFVPAQAIYLRRIEMKNTGKNFNNRELVAWMKWF